jgi:glutamate/tyrosine decarboxylase-like PLP-dependent enzyme
MTFPPSWDPLVASVFGAHRSWEATWPAFSTDASLGLTDEVWTRAAAELVGRLRENYPHFHPLYAGQMLKPPHPAAVVGYLAAMLINPNNHALDGGRATARLEKESVAALAGMFGFEEDTFMGHLTASGTVANLEALWVSRELHPTTEHAVVVSSEAHYTHKRMCALLRVPCIEIPATAEGRFDLELLDAVLQTKKVGTVVATLGTTALGALDPLAEILARKKDHGFRVHVDAAYGGYFRLLADEQPLLAPFRVTAEADSVVVDPHKHGLQPYGCGSVLFRDRSPHELYAHASPYTYFSSPEHHPGETTLECSRAGAAAAALWLTLRGMPLVPGGAMASLLTRCLEAARTFARELPRAGYAVHVPPTLDIVTYFPVRSSLSAITLATERVWRDAMEGSPPLYLAKLVVKREAFSEIHPEMKGDAAESVTILRSCLMRPEQADWAPRLVDRLSAVLLESSHT